MTDETQKQTLEKELLRSKEMIELAMDGSGAVFWDWDLREKSPSTNAGTNSSDFIRIDVSRYCPRIGGKYELHAARRSKFRRQKRFMKEA